MKKGDKFEFDDWSLDPNDIEYMDFGENQYGHEYARYYFKNPMLSKEGTFDNKSDFDRFKEFAIVNELLRNNDVKFDT